VYFVFKPDNFVKADGFFVYSEKDFVPLVTICFVKKMFKKWNTKLFIWVKDKLVSFYNIILVSVMALSGEKWI